MLSGRRCDTEKENTHIELVTCDIEAPPPVRPDIVVGSAKMLQINSMQCGLSLKITSPPAAYN